MHINMIIEENDNYLERLDPEHEIISFALRRTKASFITSCMTVNNGFWEKVDIRGVFVFE